MRLLRFTSIMSTAWTLAAAGGHLMELPGKMRYEPPLYVRLHRTLYPMFGRVAGLAEAAAVVSSAGLAWRFRRDRAAVSAQAALAAGSLAAAHAIFWGVVQPANAEMMRWRLDAIPLDWTRWRNRWEYAHAIRAGLITVALGAMTWSSLRDAPRES